MVRIDISAICGVVTRFTRPESTSISITLYFPKKNSSKYRIPLTIRVKIYTLCPVLKILSMSGNRKVIAINPVTVSIKKNGVINPGFSR